VVLREFGRRARNLAYAIAGIPWAALKCEARRACPTIDRVFWRRSNSPEIFRRSAVRSLRVLKSSCYSKVNSL
jgi:hypothetical protein